MNGTETEPATTTGPRPGGDRRTVVVRVLRGAAVSVLVVPYPTNDPGMWNLGSAYFV